jgi:hypothetical protein
MNEKELIQDLAERFGAPGVQAASLTPDYVLNTSDPDVLLLQRADGTTAAAFSARGATVRGILEAAEQDVDLSLNGGLP